MTASNTAANSLLQASAEPRLLGQTVSLFMLAMRGGLALGGLTTGLSVELIGVRHALLVNGVLAVAAHLVLGRIWTRAPAELTRTPARGAIAPPACPPTTRASGSRRSASARGDASRLPPG